jgi:hypothetical protein
MPGFFEQNADDASGGKLVAEGESRAELLGEKAFVEAVSISVSL